MGRQKQPLQVIMGREKSRLSKAEIKEREENEIKVDSDNIEAPCYLSEEQVEKYNALKDELVKVNLISNLDVDLLARYVILHDEFIKITEELSKEEVVQRVDDLKVYNPVYKELLNAQTKMTKEIRGIASDLGLSIGARLKLTIPKPEEKEKERQSEGEKLFGDII